MTTEIDQDIERIRRAGELDKLRAAAEGDIDAICAIYDLIESGASYTALWRRAERKSTGGVRA